MTKISLFLSCLFLFFTPSLFAQTGVLRHQIEELVATKNATVGVAVSGIENPDTFSILGDEHFPLQSVFKFPIAMVVLSEVDRGNLFLNQKIALTKEQLLPGLYSPLRDKYPNGATLPLSTIIEYTVSKSDNAGCDALLRLIGGPAGVETWLSKNNFKDISIKINEEVQQAHWDMQFQNWITPKAANILLQSFYNNSKNLLSKKSYRYLLKIMEGTETGAKRLKGQLPEHTVVAHKTGTSGTNKEGITAAVNDIGIVTLPGGKHYGISVFVTNSKENNEANEKIIADISIIVWDYFTGKLK